MALEGARTPVRGRWHIGPTAILVATVALSGCVSVTTADGTRLTAHDPALADYVESVFRRQNETASALAFALDAADLDSPRYVALEAAEDALLEACDALNALANARRQGDRAGAIRGLRAAREAPVCEDATRSAAAVLGTVGD